MATIETANAKGNAGIALGSTAVGIELLRALSGNGGGLQGLLGGILGNGGNTGTGVDALALTALMANAAPHGGYCCNEDHHVNRYEASKDARIAELETEVKLRDANTFTMTEMGKLRDYVDRRFEGVNASINAQAVYNATNTAALSCIQGQVAQLMSLTKLVVPNGSICPGWGDVTVSVTPATTT